MLSLRVCEKGELLCQWQHCLIFIYAFVFLKLYYILNIFFWLWSNTYSLQKFWNLQLKLKSKTTCILTSIESHWELLLIYIFNAFIWDFFFRQTKLTNYFQKYFILIVAQSYSFSFSLDLSCWLALSLCLMMVPGIVLVTLMVTTSSSSPSNLCTGLSSISFHCLSVLVVG